MKYYDKLIFELSKKGRTGYSLPSCVEPSCGNAIEELGENLLRKQKPLLPEVSEIDVVRHYTALSQMNFGVDTGFYPLGSCTMKYNPKINDEIASLDAFTQVHPLQPESSVEGIMDIYKGLNASLSAITGMAEFTFAPCAGAHGELTGLMIIRRYHMNRGDFKRTKMIVPDSAHGTNPASAAMCGLEVVEVKSKSNGLIDVEDLKPLLDDTVAGIMMTNPNTLGLFEKDIEQIATLVHDCGGLLYYDGANLNALLGVARPGDMGFDVLHLNLHKTFSTPHGGGGPGSGPVGVVEKLRPCLPSSTEDNLSAGKVSGFMGNFLVSLKAYVYILSLGKENTPLVGRLAVLNANYIKERLRDCYELPIDSICKHEFVFDGVKDGQENNVTTLDVAKRLLDYGYHAPTIYFPLLFHQAIMIEPTETESKETIDLFIEAMRLIAKESHENPELLRTAPHNTPIGRPDETGAARNPLLTYQAAL